MFVDRLARTIVRSGMDFIYPRSCVWCRSLLPERLPHDQRFCLECLKKIAPPFPDRCHCCSAPVGPNLDTSKGCIHCNREKMHYGRVLSLGPYTEEMRLACLKCKHPHQTTLTSALADLLFNQAAEDLRKLQPDFIVPVPHHWTDRLSRDHAAVTIGERLARHLRIPIHQQALSKCRRTAKQQSLPASSRKPNLRDAFKARLPRSLQNRCVLLVDDVLTTGITADQCTLALLKAGARKVDVAVLARSIGS